jgi:hypothetical protein
MSSRLRASKRTRPGARADSRGARRAQTQRALQAGAATIALMVVAGGVRVLLAHPSPAHAPVGVASAASDARKEEGLPQAARTVQPKPEELLIGHWKVDSDSAETREALRRSAATMSDALRSLGGDSGTSGNYDVEQFVANALRTLATLDVQFTPDSILVSREQQTKSLSYEIVERKFDALVLKTAGNSSLVPPGPMLVRFLGADALQVGSGTKDSVALFLHRLPDKEAAGTSPPG